MEHSLEHVRDKNDSVKSTQKINLARKHKGVMSPYELQVENGRKLTNYGRVVEELSSITRK